MPLTNPLSYEESGINLTSVLLLQGIRTRSTENPLQMMDNSFLPQRPIKVEASRSMVKIWLRGELIFDIFKYPYETDKEWNGRVDHIRHDYVASMLQDTTDTPFSNFGIDSPLTPDKISDNGNCVLELATTVSSRQSKTEEDFKQKLLAYRSVTEQNNMMLTILCVSGSHVYTNCYLRFDMTPEFCRRLREAGSIEMEISAQTGRTPNQASEDGDEDVKSIESIMNEMSEITKNVSWDFNEELENLSLEGLLEEDSSFSSKIMNSTWRESSRLIKKLPDQALDDYQKTLRLKETRCDMKRIFTFPAISPCYTGKTASASDFIFFSENDIDDEEFKPLAHLFRLGVEKLEIEQREVPVSTHLFTSLAESLTGNASEEPHKLRRDHSFQDTLSERERDIIALSGPGSKLRQEMDEIIEDSQHQKKSFDISSPTEDIDRFLNDNTLIDHDARPRSLNPIHRLISSSQVKESKQKISKKLFEWASDLGICRYGNFVSDLCLELSYEYKTPHKENIWTCKAMRNHDCLILLKSTGSHTFFSILTKKDSTEKWDTGRLGANLCEVGNYIMSDFCSVVESTLDHFIKAGPYLTSMSTYLMQHFKVPFMTKNFSIPQEYWKTLKSIFVIYMNNKIDLENLVLDCRFLYMKVLQKFEGDPYQFIDRLPTVLRSRLSVYFLNKVMALMKKYRNSKPKQIRVHGVPESDPNSVRFTGLRCIFHDSPLQLDQLVDTFYFSYTISKMKGKVGDRSLKIVSKIIKEEMWARDNITEIKDSLWANQDVPEKQKWSASFMKKMIDILKSRWKILYGENSVLQLNRKISLDFARAKFTDVSTLKASSRNHENPEINLPRNDDGKLHGREYVDELKRLNPKMEGKRPRVITSLMRLIKQYALEKNDYNPTLQKLLPYSMRELSKRGYIYSDCFPKDQHGGEREIHVLEIMARIVQFFIERSAKSMSYLFKSDSVLNPKKKDSFMKDHEVSAQSQLGNHMTMCKSADATKWCQRHHVSKFFFIMSRLTDGAFNPLFYNGFYLWTVKRVSIPEELVSILDSSKFPESDNKTLLWLQDRFKRGVSPFVGTSSDTIEVKFGMFQGIFHRVSSICHSIVQEFYSHVVREKARQDKFSLTISVIQGSDDSACCISYNKKTPGADAYVHILLKWKEEFQKFASIWPSEAKSSIGTQLFIEYNSEWWYRGKILKPTFRWVSACLETTIVETFYQRMQLFSDGLTTAVEMGVSTLCASTIQKSQAWLHYHMMGFSNHILRDHVVNSLLQNPHPALGFFPLDGEEYCGITGFDFSLYVLQREWNVSLLDTNREMIHPSSLLDYDEKVDKTFRRDLKRIFVGFGNKRLWEKVVKDIDIGALEDAIEIINKKPQMLYQEGKNWEDQRVHMILKLFQRGVRESLSSYQPTIRSSTSSAYLFNRPCVSKLNPITGKKEKMSLYKAILDSTPQTNSLISDTPPATPLQKVESNLPMFVHDEEYNDFYSYIQDMRQGVSFQNVPYGRHSRVVVPVWGEIHMNETPLIDICKRALFSMNSVHISKTSFGILWNECKLKFRFLKDTYEETLEASGLDHMQLFDFLQSASHKTRKVTLQDTSAKNPHLTNSLSRIYWPQIKVRSRAVNLEENASNMRHLLMCAMTFPFSSKHLDRVMKQIFDKSGLKSMPLNRCPHRTKKLKVISDFWLSKNKEQALYSIPQVKNGVLGFFVRNQRKARGQDGILKYTGDGVWVGTVCGIDTVIHLQNEEVVKITVKAMRDTISLSKRLTSLVKELKQKFTSSPSRSTSLYYLNPKGHFMVSPLPISECIRVEVEGEMTPIDYSRLMTKEWGVQVDKTTLRLYYIEDIDNESPSKITLLSETLTRRDWAPELTPHDTKWTKSKSFSSFCKGEPIGVYELLDDIGVNPNSDYTKDILSRSEGPELNVGVFSLNKIGIDFQKYLVASEGSKTDIRSMKEDISKAELESLKFVKVEDEDIMNLLRFEEEPQDVSKVMLDWAEEMNDFELRKKSEESFLDEVVLEERGGDNLMNEDEELEDNQWNVETKMIEGIAELFFDLDFEDIGIFEKDFDTLRVMPLENQFWLDIKNMIKSEVSGKEMIKCLCRNQKQDENHFLLSHGAFFFSLACRENVYSKERRPASSQLETSINISTRDPLVAKEDIETHVESLRKKLSELENAIAMSSSYVKSLLEKKREELLVQLEAYTHNTQEIYLEDINYFEFMDRLLRELKKENVYDKTDQSSELEVLVTLLISDVLESTISKNKSKMISDSDLNEVRSRIWDRMFSGSLVRYIANAFNISIFIEKDGEEIFSYGSRLSLKDIVLEFSQPVRKSLFSKLDGL